MEFRTMLEIQPIHPRIRYQEKIMLTGSCFSENMGERMELLKFDVLQNPHGITYNPLSLAHSLITCIENKKYGEEDLFYFNDVWNSWDHHSRFSHPDKDKCLSAINEYVQKAHDCLLKAGWLIITPGTAFVYELKPGTGFSPRNENIGNRLVSNCHKAPSSWFSKRLLSLEEILSAMDHLIHRLFSSNNKLNIIFTVSPVRHIRDGLVENNRSKALLVQVVHHLVDKFSRLYYFPAYELVIDDLRDYRFYNSDLVHPNQQAIDYVWDRFTEACMDPLSLKIMKEVKEIVSARNHRPINPSSESHKKFLKTYAEKASALVARYPFLDFSSEIKYFADHE